MRIQATLGLLLLVTACDDAPLEVREAGSEPAASEVGEAPESEAPESEAPESEPPEDEPIVQEAGDAHVDAHAESQQEAEVHAEPDTVTVEILEAGRGPVALRGATVRVHYEAWLASVHAEDGEPFDSSVSRLVPLELRLGGGAVIEGLWRGLLGLHEGSRARLRVPAELAWGAVGNEAAGVPADSDLVYEVRVVAVR